MKHIFILNQFSLENATPILKKQIEKVCVERKIDYTIEVNDMYTSTEDILKKYQNGKNIIMAVGGDGTINRVLNNIVNTNNILGYIPYGTGNDFYRTNKELLKPGINTIDLVEINDRYFINVACFGIDAEIGNNDDLVHSRLIPKKYRYKLSLLANFIKYKPRYFEVEVNNRILREYFTTIAVCNARYYGGGYKVSPNSAIDDGKLEIILAKQTNKYNMAKMVSSMKDATHLYYPEIEVVQTTEIMIKSNKEITCNIDGEELTDTIFDIKLINKGVKIYYDQELIDSIINVKANKNFN